jgi:hypothetical protein
MDGWQFSCGATTADNSKPVLEELIGSWHFRLRIFFENRRLNPLTRLSRDRGIATLSFKGARAVVWLVLCCAMKIVHAQDCFENSWVDPLTRLSRDRGIATLSLKGEGCGPVVFMLG